MDSLTSSSIQFDVGMILLKSGAADLSAKNHVTIDVLFFHREKRGEYFMKMPTCCDSEMRSEYETTKFMEAHCGVCGDVVFVKKESIQKPQLIDD